MGAEKTSLEKDALTRQVRGLCGRRIVRVRYFDVFWGDVEPETPHCPRGMHQLGFGVDLDLDNGSVLGITWGWQIVEYALHLVNRSLVMELGRSVFRDVTEDPEWAPPESPRIVDAKLYWLDAFPPRPDHHGMVPAPQDLALVLDSGTTVYFSSAEYDEASDRLYGLADALVVIFGDEVAQRYAVGRYRS